MCGEYVHAWLAGLAEVRTLDMTSLLGAGVLHTKFWIVDEQHFYVGSANMDWRSFTQVNVCCFHCCLPHPVLFSLLSTSSCVVFTVVYLILCCFHCCLPHPVLISLLFESWLKMAICNVGRNAVLVCCVASRYSQAFGALL